MSSRKLKSHRKLFLEKLEDKLPLSGNNPLIYWTEGNAVYRSDVEGSLTEEVISISSDYGELTDIDIDREAGNLYMATSKNHDPVNIHRATIDGSDYQLHGDSEDFGSIMQAIGVDPVSKKVYVSPHHLEAYKPGAAPGGMQRLSADGTTVETFAQKPWYVVDIEVDAPNGHVYYSGHTGFTGIRRMDLDGSNDIGINTHAFNGFFALDVTAGKIYYGKNHWTDSSSGKTIYSCNLDGSDIQTVVEDTGGRFYDMDLFDNVLYLNSKSEDADGNYIKSYNIATTEFTTLFEADGNPAEEVYYDIAVYGNSETLKKRTYALSDHTVFGEIAGTYRDTYWKNQYSQSIKETLFRAYKRSRLEHQWEFELVGGDVSMEFFVNAGHDATNEQFRFQYQVEGSSQWKTLVTTTQNESKQYYARIVDPDLAVDGKVKVRVVDTDRQDDDERATITVDRIFFLARRLTNLDEAVNVLVFDPEGAEGGGNKAQFRFQLADRNRLDHDVEVFYELSGTAQNSDYREALRGSKTIKAGNLMTRIFVTPRSDKNFEGAESVTVRILDTDAYRLTGDPEATVMIHDEDLVTLEAYGEVTNYGSHSPNYQETYYQDDRWERVTEEIYAGGNRTRMDHRWKFDLAGESEVVLKGRFEITSESDQDDFQVVYSTDGTSWKSLGRVIPDAGVIDLEKAMTLPGDVGVVWVRMFDRYRKNGDTTPTTVAIDHLCFERVESSAMPPVMFFPPAPQMMLANSQARRPVEDNLFSLLGQGNDDLQELLEDQDPKELEAFYRQWQAEDRGSIEFSEWLENQLEIAI